MLDVLEVSTGESVEGIANARSITEYGNATEFVKGVHRLKLDQQLSAVALLSTGMMGPGERGRRTDLPPGDSGEWRSDLLAVARAARRPSA
jgi:hypothetical protein